MVGWGLWGFFTKLAAVHMNVYQAMFYTMSLSIPMIAIALWFGGTPPPVLTRGSLYAILAGLAVNVSFVPFFLAMRTGKASVVVTVTALYPLITILLALVFLHESIGVRQLIGMGFALSAMFLLAL